jgi:AcrR family transcriptional regulator
VGASEALVHKYFGTKADLYLEIVSDAMATLLQRQVEADAALGPGATAFQRVARSIEIYLDFITSAPEGWAAPLRNPHDGFPLAAELRAQSRVRYVERLRTVLDQQASEPRDHALHGYLGFLDAACLAWVNAGCVTGQRPAVVAMSLGALEGALEAVEALDRP